METLSLLTHSNFNLHKNAPPNTYRTSNLMKTKFPALLQLLGGYFHEDWKHDHKTEDEAIQQFLKHSTKETKQKVSKELLTILRLFRIEGELEDFFV
ncbi:contact-dependent growth inhibition system immunity protein [Pseudomonas sp. R16(2017)]|uniref:contact-dependent growth inhibition system immunity protein n=1 Tax=unclassified Pseudomonas TaxID=196821 RepID=UPI0034CDCCBE